MELQMCGQCSQRVCEGLLAAWVAQPSAASPKKSEWKKSPTNSTARSLSQSHPKRWFSSLPWALKISVGGAKKVLPRAPGPPRLAAGAGDRNAETLKDFYVLGT